MKKVILLSFIILTSLSVKGIELAKKGMGIFTPNFYDYAAMYIYGNVNFEKGVDEHMPVDSVTFVREDGPFYAIKTAPPYLVPHYMKMDYEALQFKVITVYKDWLEIEVNKFTGQTALVDRYKGKLQLWSDFLLHVFSVELKDEHPQELKIKPLEYASSVNLTYSFLRPMAIRGSWMKVDLVNDNFEKLGSAWLRWQDDDKLLIDYSLLS